MEMYNKIWRKSMLTTPDTLSMPGAGKAAAAGVTAGLENLPGCFYISGAFQLRQVFERLSDYEVKNVFQEDVSFTRQKAITVAGHMTSLKLGCPSVRRMYKG
jgi:hypothetical protein